MYMYMLNSHPFVCPIDLTPVERPVRVKHPLKKVPHGKDLSQDFVLLLLHFLLSL